jgi:dTDP-glucose 4,6-dehydratase
MRPLANNDLEEILQRTRSLWDEMRGARIFVTGGTGFFGCWITESFIHANRRLNLGAQMVLLTRNRERFCAKAPHLTSAPKIELCVGDAKTFAFPAGQFDFAFHIATETRPNYAAIEAAELLAGNVAGTQHFLEFVRASGVRKFLFTSSGAAYGPQPTEIEFLREDHPFAPDPMNPASAYGESKRASELLCGVATVPGHCEGKVARCFAFVGPHLPLDANYAVGNFLNDALAGRALKIGGDGTPRRSYLYAADLAAWLWTILLRGGPARIYNVGARRHFSIGEIAEIVRREVAPQSVVEVARTPVPGAAVNRYVPDNARARSELALDEWVDLPEAIRRTAAWHRDSTRPIYL